MKNSLGSRDLGVNKGDLCAGADTSERMYGAPGKGYEAADNFEQLQITNVLEVNSFQNLRVEYRSPSADPRKKDSENEERVRCWSTGI